MIYNERKMRRVTKELVCNACEMGTGEETFADACSELHDPRICKIAQETAGGAAI